MRLPRWAPWVEGVLSASPAITSVKSFADTGLIDPRFGHIVTLPTGAQIEMQWVRTSPSTGDDHEEVPVTGEPPTPVTLPETPSSGRTSLRLIEQYLVALIANAGNPEIRVVERKSTREDAGPRPCGVIVRMHSGADIFGVFRRMVPAGATIGQGDEFQQREEV